MNKIKNNKKGFTLLELLVVVLIIGILAAIALPQYQHVVDKSRYANLMNITKAIAEANERYYMVHDKYSTNFSKLDIDIPANSMSNNKAIAYFDWGYCRLANQQEVICYDMVRLKNLFTVYYKNSSFPARRNAMYCGALTRERNSRFDKVCQAFGNYKELTDASYDGQTYPCLFYHFGK